MGRFRADAVSDGAHRPSPDEAQPIRPDAADQAAQWLTLLMSGEATDEDQLRWQQWRVADSEHERAWGHIERITGRLKVMVPKAAYEVLSPDSARLEAGTDRLRGRRKALRLLIWGGVTSTSGLLASRTQTWRHSTADHRTGTGEQRSVMLVDGSQIVLNTASAIDVRFDGEQRVVRLVAGEILIETGHAAPEGGVELRPFVVETEQGRIRALGTRFSVRQQGDRTHVAVIEGAVAVTASEALASSRVIHAGEQASFARHAIDASFALDPQAMAWLQGQIVADDMRLGDFLADLGRYRPGLLRCDPAVADLRLSGVFPLRETDRILSSLPHVLPVQVRRRTRYWVMVQAAP